MRFLKKLIKLFNFNMVFFLSIIVLDIFTKNWIVSQFVRGGIVGFGVHNSEVVSPAFFDTITSFFNIVLVFNKGVSFSMFTLDAESGKWIFFAINVLVSMVLFSLMKGERRRIYRVGYLLIIAGAIGNAIDRVRFGAVVDFLDFHYLGFHWPSFNVADIAISTGVGLFILYEVLKVFKVVKKVIR